MSAAATRSKKRATRHWGLAAVASVFALAVAFGFPPDSNIQVLLSIMVLAIVVVLTSSLWRLGRRQRSERQLGGLGGTAPAERRLAESGPSRTNAIFVPCSLRHFTSVTMRLRNAVIGSGHRIRRRSMSSRHR